MYLFLCYLVMWIVCASSDGSWRVCVVMFGERESVSVAAGVCVLEISRSSPSCRRIKWGLVQDTSPSAHKPQVTQAAAQFIKHTHTHTQTGPAMTPTCASLWTLRLFVLCSVLSRFGVTLSISFSACDCWAKCQAAWESVSGVSPLGVGTICLLVLQDVARPRRPSLVRLCGWWTAGLLAGG